MDKEHSTPAGYGFLDRIVQIVADAVRSREHLVEEVLECIEHGPAEREQWKAKVEEVCDRLYGKSGEEI